MWSSSALLRKLAFFWYQDVTKKYMGLKSTDINLTVTEYHAGTKMERNGIWAGSSEVEAAADLLQTTIRVWYVGNPNIPMMKWITYGEKFTNASSYVILLQWTHGNHCDFVQSLKGF